MRVSDWSILLAQFRPALSRAAHFHPSPDVIACCGILEHMTETKKDPERKLEPKDYEIYHDSTGVMHFLPPKRCKACED